MGVKQKHRVVFLASGRGSNFEALALAIQKGTVRNAEAAALVSNRKDAPALEIARKLGVPTTVLDQTTFRGKSGKFDRESYSLALADTLTAYAPDWVCLAGYMLLLPPEIVHQWPSKILNIHPSLLPLFPGLRAQAQALKAGANETGCTVHLVSEEMDAGPILEQSSLKVEADDTEESLTQRLLPLEHQTYIRALEKICSVGFQVVAGKVVWTSKN
jgi:phosphoribosylglycinamide formyltransferase 1